MLSFIFQKSCNGQQLLERVFTHMDILERDYFGLKYLDANSVSQWLDPRKPIKKQSKDKGKNDLFTILPSIMLRKFQYHSSKNLLDRKILVYRIWVSSVCISCEILLK